MAAVESVRLPDGECRGSGFDAGNQYLAERKRAGGAHPLFYFLALSAILELVESGCALPMVELSTCESGSRERGVRTRHFDEDSRSTDANLSCVAPAPEKVVLGSATAITFWGETSRASIRFSRSNLDIEVDGHPGNPKPKPKRD